MEKTIIIRITNPTKAQDALLQRLMRAFGAEHIEVQENTAFTLLSGNLQIDSAGWCGRPARRWT